MNKRVLITGAYGGVGKALAHVFSSKGYDLILLGRSSAKLALLETELASSGCSIESLVCDVSSLRDCQKVAEKVQGNIDVLIQNAGITYIQELGKGYDLARFDEVISTNLNGGVYLTQLLLEKLKEKSGSIVVVSSVAGYAPVIGRTAYAASKFGLDGFYKVLEAELNDLAHIMMVYPTFIATGIRDHVTGDKTVNETLTAQQVAEDIYRGLLHKKRRLYLGKTAKISYYLSKYLPSVYVKLMRKKIQKDG